jgi:serine/threonine protein phosphatase 1
MGNHGLMFVVSSFNVQYRDKHRSIGGEWVDHIDSSEYQKLTTQCIQQLPLTIKLECEHSSLGLVHAQSPADNWQGVQKAVPSDQFAIDCTWPWNRAQGQTKPLLDHSRCVWAHWYG